MRSDATSSNLHQPEADTLIYTELSSVAQDYYTLPHTTLLDGPYQISTLLLNSFIKKYSVALLDGRHLSQLEGLLNPCLGEARPLLWSRASSPKAANDFFSLLFKDI